MGSFGQDIADAFVVFMIIAALVGAAAIGLIWFLVSVFT